MGRGRAEPGRGDLRVERLQYLCEGEVARDILGDQRILRDAFRQPRAERLERDAVVLLVGHAVRRRHLLEQGHQGEIVGVARAADIRDGSVEEGIAREHAVDDVGHRNRAGRAGIEADLLRHPQVVREHVARESRLLLREGETRLPVQDLQRLRSGERVGVGRLELGTPLRTPHIGGRGALRDAPGELRREIAEGDHVDPRVVGERPRRAVLITLEQPLQGEDAGIGRHVVLCGVFLDVRDRRGGGHLAVLDPQEGNACFGEDAGEISVVPHPEPVAEMVHPGRGIGADGGIVGCATVAEDRKGDDLDMRFAQPTRRAGCPRDGQDLGAGEGAVLDERHDLVARGLEHRIADIPDRADAEQQVHALFRRQAAVRDGVVDGSQAAAERAHDGAERDQPGRRGVRGSVHQHGRDRLGVDQPVVHIVIELGDGPVAHRRRRIGRERGHEVRDHMDGAFG